MYTQQRCDSLATKTRNKKEETLNCQAVTEMDRGQPRNEVRGWRGRHILDRQSRAYMAQLMRKKNWSEGGEERRRMRERGSGVLTLSDRDRGGEGRDGETTSVSETCC